MSYDLIIIGAGIVGLGTAFQITERRPDWRILVLDKADRIAAHQTGHNSGVIHSGVYYQPGGTRAVHCRHGYQLLLDFCDRYGVPYHLTGKIIVATQPDEVPRLDEIERRGQANGLEGLKRLRAEEISEYEPHAGGVSALYVPQAGIIDYTRVAERYAELVRERGGEIRLSTEVTGIVPDGDSWQVQTTAGDFPGRQLVNCAGLYSDRISKMTMPEVDVQILPFRGEYYRLKESRSDLVRGLIYPVPNPAFPFLGVHLTRMIRGGVEAGPNAVLAFAREGYTNRTVNWSELWEILTYRGFHRIAWQYWREGWAEMRRSFSKQLFYEALRPLLPDLTMEDLEPAGAGVRAMACDHEGNLVDDYLFFSRPGVLNVANAPSPAATASLAIGETVARKVIGEGE
ncbi:MAG: L-2-hydroxyglutarate oxidase [Lewinella sp.]|nr:L-2-hydroxyglutarate oxidase [Lewinella sp.]